jgi:hypothetical protein
MRPDSSRYHRPLTAQTQDEEVERQNGPHGISVFEMEQIS